jgi:hypothetical protein
VAGRCNGRCDATDADASAAATLAGEGVVADDLGADGFAADGFAADGFADDGFAGGVVDDGLVAGDGVDERGAGVPPAFCAAESGALVVQTPSRQVTAATAVGMRTSRPARRAYTSVPLCCY